ncbi:glycoside hydrolase [Tsuneonella mangrovi]|uniref:glycoside hydrolase n=1 Tax=Tsuneonella mangrovi TaxID=1982042 RepID=UPI000BA2B2CF|nr:glycoside hydrolase [Tsuneonella mangrovi]
MKLAIAAALIVLLGLPATSLAEAPARPDRVVEIDLSPDLAHRGPVFEGWGTALAWFANVTGGWPEPERERLADLFYGPSGLGWNIARYNIGGGNSPDTSDCMRVGAAVPGFWKRPAGTTGKDWWDPADPSMWDWHADTNQRWWLGAIKRRVDHPIFEAFSNSPPYFMTISGRVSGNEKGDEDNLRPGFEGKFADYLATVVQQLQERDGIRFRTLSPVNEPGTNYWHASNTQEGSHWDPASQARMIMATADALKHRGLSTVVAAPDETSSQLFVKDWEAYPEEARQDIGQINVHSYGTQNQTAVRDIARSQGLRLWMSEDDTPLAGEPEDFEGMDTPIAFAEHVVRDLKRLEPSAWVFWQAVETISAIDGRKGTNWGLVKADLRDPSDQDHRITITKKYWAMAQFSRFIRPGFRLLPVADPDTVGAIGPDGKRIVLVHVNAGPVARNLDLPQGWKFALVATDLDHNAACVAGRIAPPRSISTVVLYRDPRQSPCR